MLRRLLSLLSDAVESFLQLGFKLRNPLLGDFAHLTDRAFPSAKLILFVFIWGNDEEETHSIFVDFAVLSFNLMNVGGEVAEQLEFRLGRVEFSVVNSACKRIAHDCDQHVKHRDLSEEGRKSEEEEAESTLSAALKVIQIVIAKHKQ